MGGGAGAGEDGGGGGEAQRAWTRDDQHRHRRDEGLFKVAGHEQPGDEGERGEGEHAGHEHGAHPIHQTLHGCLAGLCLRDEAHDARQRGRFAHRRRPNLDEADAVDGATRHGIANALRHRHAFAADEGFIHFAGAFDHLAIHRHTAARAHQHQVSLAHPLRRHHGFRAVFGQQASGVWTQREERLQRRRGAALGAVLQVLAEQDESDDDGGCLEVEAAVRLFAECAQQVPAIAVRGGGAERHQHIHVGGAGAERVPCPAIEAQADEELDGRRQQHLGGRHHVQLFVARRGEAHADEERRRQHGGHHQGAPLGFEAGLVQRLRGGQRLGGGPRVVAGAVHRVQQVFEGCLLAAEHHVRPFQGQVHPRFDDARDIVQRPLDAARAHRARHAFNVEIDALGVAPRQERRTGFIHGEPRRQSWR